MRSIPCSTTTTASSRTAICLRYSTHPTSAPRFTNVSQQTATAVEFRFSYVDTVGDTVGADELTIAGKFSPGVAIDGTKKECRPFKGQIDDALDLYYAGQHSTMDGTVIYVKYADGTVWHSAPSTSAH